MSKKIQKIIFYIFLIYSVIGFFILPYVLKSQIISNVEKETNAKMSIESVYFNPLIFKLQILGIKLNTADGENLLSLKSLTFNVEVLSSLFNSGIHLKEFVLQKPEISLIYYSDKTLNFSKIAKASNESKESKPKKEDNSTSKLPRIILDRVAIIDGKVSYDDYTHSTKFDFSFDNIGFELQDIDTNDFNTSDATLRFYSSLGDGGFIDLKSKFLGFKPLVVEGSLNFEASKLYTQWRYLQDNLNLEVADGKISFYMDYNFNLDELNSTTINNLNLSLDGLRVKPKNKYKDVLNLNSFYVKNATIKPMLQDIYVEKIGLDSLYIKSKRDENGKIDWLEYIKSNSDVSANNGLKSHKDKDEFNTTKKVWNILVDNISLEKIKLDFDDKGVEPQVNTRVNELNLYMQNVTLLGEEPLFYQLNSKINESFRCSFDGDLRHKQLDLNSYTKCRDFNIIHYQPYVDEAAAKALSIYDVKMSSAVVNFDTNVSVTDVDKELIVSVNDANFNLNKFGLKKRSTDESLVNFSDFDIKGVKFNTKDKDVIIKKVVLDSLDIKVQKAKDGSLSVENLIVPLPKESKSKINNKDSREEDIQEEKSYRVKLKHFALKSAKTSFNDKTLSPNILSKIDKFNINAYDIDSNVNSWLKYDISLRVNNLGYVKANGNLRHTPLKQKGIFELQKISLKELTPYIQERANISIDDGYLNLKSKTKYSVSELKADLSVDGSLNIEEFFVNDSRDNSSLVSFSGLGLNSFTLELSPNRFFINEVDLKSFYVNAIIDENKKINFASLMKTKDGNETQNTENNTTAEVKEKFPLKIMKLNVSNGSANFADLSLPLKFKTNIHDLNGAVYAISNMPTETSYVDINGIIDKYGSTKLKGSLNAGDPKAYTDISFNFKNIELSSLSGYSANFAGYEIDNGKLYLDLGYKILDSELLGENSIIIKNIELGDEVEDENITSLPLGFVIALLEDSDGVIDMDMPVEGNVDEPDFKYGALVWKTLGNLILKAVTSPFGFLGSMMGIDGDNLEYAEFEPGEINILPPEQEKLDDIAKMLIKRPKISLAISGKYDSNIDKKAIQEQKLAQLIVEKSGLKNKQDYKSAMTVELLEEIYNDLREDDKLQSIKKELGKKHKDETLNRAYLSAIIEECIKMQPILEDELNILAQKRSNIIKNYLVDIKNIDTFRIKLLDAGVSEGENDKLIKTKLQVEVE